MCLQIGFIFDNHWEGIREAGNMSHYKKKKQLIIQKFFLESFHSVAPKKLTFSPYSLIFTLSQKLK